MNSGTALGLQDRDLWHLAGGHLDPVEEDSGAAGADLSCGKGLKGSVDDGPSAFAIEPVRHFNADLVRTGGALGAAVEVTERACRAWRATGNGVRWA